MKMAQKPDYSNLRCCIACLKDESVVCVENCKDSNIIDIYKVLVKGEIDQLGIPTLAICDFCSETLQLIIEFQKQCFQSIDSLKSKLDFNPEAIFIKEEEIEFDEVIQMNKIEMVFVEEEAKEQFNDSNTNLSSDDDEAFDETQPAGDDDDDESDHQSSEDTKMETEEPSPKNEVVVKKRSQIRHQCKQCNLSFFISQLKRHMVKKHRGSSRCKYCNDIFPDKEELKQHIQEEETKRPSLFCEICGFSTKVKAELKSHITKDHMSNLPRIICDICGKGFSRKHNFKKHFIMHHTDEVSIEQYLKIPNKRERHQCNQCDSSFHTPVFLKRHILKTHQGGSRCKYCLNVFLDNEEFEQHMHEEEAKRPSLCCKMCGFSTKWRKDLTNHISAHMSEEPKFICDLCGRSYQFRRTFKKHFIMNHMDKASLEQYLETQTKGLKYYQCKQCDSANRNPYFFKRHILKRHPGTCYYCQNVFLDKEEFKKHTQEEKFKAAMERCLKTPKYRKKEPKRHSCDQCDGSYINARELKRHVMKRHQGGSTCRYCQNIFVDQEEYEQHMREEEAKTRPDSTACCEICGFTTKAKGGLGKHIKKRHSPDQPPLICDICGKTYKLRAEFKQHFIMRHMEKAFQCNECGNKFPFNHELQRHIRNFHSPEGAVFVKCKLCEKTLKKYSLGKHVLLVHRRVRKHKCTICSMAFLTSQVLKNHMKTHDPKRIKIIRKKSQPQKSPIMNPEPLSDKQQPEQEQRFLSTPNNFPCNECDLSFKTKFDFKQHQITTHLDKEMLDKNYVSCKFCNVKLRPGSMFLHVKALHINARLFNCNQCEKTFNSSIALRRHQVVHEGEPKFNCNLCPKTYYMLASLQTHFRKGHGLKYSMEDVRRVCGSGN